ncbi:MAG: hypothetical protein ABIP12_00475 [Terriglobales bacterium]
MMRSSHTVLWLTLVLITVSGCKKKQKPVAGAVIAPTITAPVTTAPIPEAQPAPVPDKPPVVAEKAKPRPRPKPPKRVVVKESPDEPAKPPAETIAKATPPRIVVQPTSAVPGEGQPSVVPDMSHTQDAHTRLSTEQLMLSTEANLKSLKGVLSAEDRSLLQQVQLFMQQSREASQAQDLVRAHNLALKAHLLSDELVR